MDADGAPTQWPLDLQGDFDEDARRNRIAGLGDGDDLIECIASAITDDLAGRPNELAVTYELYGGAVRLPPRPWRVGR